MLRSRARHGVSKRARDALCSVRVELHRRLPCCVTIDGSDACVCDRDAWGRRWGPFWPCRCGRGVRGRRAWRGRDCVRPSGHEEGALEACASAPACRAATVRADDRLGTWGRSLLNVDDYRRQAKARLPRGLFEFVAGGTEDQFGVDELRRVMEALRNSFRPCLSMSPIDR